MQVRRALDKSDQPSFLKEPSRDDNRWRRLLYRQYEDLVKALNLLDRTPRIPREKMAEIHAIVDPFIDGLKQDLKEQLELTVNSNDSEKVIELTVNPENELTVNSDQDEDQDEEPEDFDGPF